MRWKKNKIDTMLDAETDEVCRDMTVMTIAKKEAILIG